MGIINNWNSIKIKKIHENLIFKAQINILLKQKLYYLYALKGIAKSHVWKIQWDWIIQLEPFNLKYNN